MRGFFWPAQEELKRALRVRSYAHCVSPPRFIVYPSRLRQGEPPRDG